MSEHTPPQHAPIEQPDAAADPVVPDTPTPPVLAAQENEATSGTPVASVAEVPGAAGLSTEHTESGQADSGRTTTGQPQNDHEEAGSGAPSTATPEPDAMAQAAPTPAEPAPSAASTEPVEPTEAVVAPALVPEPVVESRLGSDLPPSASEASPTPTAPTDTNHPASEDMTASGVAAAPTAPPVVPAAPVAPPPPAGSIGPAAFGRVAEDGTVFVRIGEEEREVGSYPGASPEEAIAYFARKFDEVSALADLLHQRVTQTDLSAKDGADSLRRLRSVVEQLRAVGDFATLHARVEQIATALEVRRTTENEARSAARAEAIAMREAIVAEAEQIAAQPEAQVQWKASSARMRALLEEWKTAQRQGPKVDRDSEQKLWHRLSASRNSFDKMRRVHFAQLGATQAEAKAAKEALVAEAEALTSSTDWGATAGAYKRLMDRWRQAGRASRSDDDALWTRFKAAQDAFFSAKDEVVAAENVEFEANLAVKEELLAQAQAILPVTDVEAAKAALRPIQEKWDAAGKVPRSAMDRIEKGMRRVEQSVRDAEDKKWARTNPEVQARAHSLATQLEAAVASLREDLARAEARGDAKRIAKAKEALEAREAWLAQARAGLQEFGG